MSLFNKVLNRAAISGMLTVPIAKPKGGAILNRTSDDEETSVAPMRRMEAEQGENETLQAISRQPEEEEQASPLQRISDNDETVRSLHRMQEDEEETQVQSLRRQQDEVEQEDTAQALRSENEGNEEEAQAIHRQASPASDEQDMQTLRRAVLEPSSDTERLNAMATSENIAEQELPDMQELRRDGQMSFPVVAAESSMSQADDPAPAEHSLQSEAVPSPFTHNSHTEPFTASHNDTSERPRVTIDQIDVVIHEDSGSGTQSLSPRSNSSADVSRRMSARYLRGL